MSSGVSGERSRFIDRMRFAGVPEAAVRRAKEVVLDYLGIQLGASTLLWREAPCRYVRGVNATGKVPVVEYGFRTQAEFASIANAILARGFGLDDWHSPTWGPS